MCARDLVLFPRRTPNQQCFTLWFFSDYLAWQAIRALACHERVAWWSIVRRLFSPRALCCVPVLSRLSYLFPCLSLPYFPSSLSLHLLLSSSVCLSVSLFLSRVFRYDNYSRPSNPFLVPLTKYLDRYAKETMEYFLDREKLGRAPTAGLLVRCRCLLLCLVDAFPYGSRNILVTSNCSCNVKRVPENTIVCS